MSSREDKSGKALRALSGVLPVRPAGLVRPGLRSSLLGSAGAVLAVLAAVPFLSASAKASIPQWVKSAAPDGIALHQQSSDPVQYLKLAKHTNVPHSNSTPHGDQTDPWGTHIDTTGDHTDTAHTNTSGGAKA